MWFLIVPEGRQVELTFDTFEMEQSDNCENDYVEIREAYFEEPHDPQELEGRSGPILANSPYCGSTNPGTIQSAGNMVWVHFKSDSNATTTYKGFKASFKAGTYHSLVYNCSRHMHLKGLCHQFVVLIWEVKKHVCTDGNPK